jgi:SAM-dependent methyltransferase
MYNFKRELRRVYQKIKPLPIIGGAAVLAVRIARSTFRSTSYRRITIKLRNQSEVAELKNSISYLSAAIEGINGAITNTAAQIVSRISMEHDCLEFTRDEIMFEIRKSLRMASQPTPGQSEKKHTVESKIVNKSKLDVRPLRLNLGCGHVIVPELVNIDSRELPEIDLVADVTNIPLESGSVSEIYAAHLIEHFPRRYLLDVVLPHWIDLLRPGGRIKLVTPNAKAMIYAFHQGQMSFDDLALVTFGNQEYDGNFHYAMFSPESMVGLLEDAGMCDVQVICADRVNGLCREMEIHATKQNRPTK